MGAALIVAACGGAARGGSVGAGLAERISLTADACAPGWRAPSAGSYRFEIADSASQVASVALEQALSGIVVARLGQASPGTVQALGARLRAGGAYRFSCTLSGSAPRFSAAIQIPWSRASAAAAPPEPQPPATVELLRPLSAYRSYVENLLGRLRVQLESLRAQLADGSPAGAEASWRTAHLTWLELGQDDGAYGAFGGLGGEIDGTAAGIPGGSASPQFTGFHRVELDLWRSHNLTAASHDAAVLTRLVDELTPRTVAADLPGTTLGIDGWVLRCHEILEDALRDSLTGNDDYGSNSDLAALIADVTATREMLRMLAPLIAPRRPPLVPTAIRQLAAIDGAVAAVPRATTTGVATLSLRARQRIDATTDAALETLAPVSELMQVGNS